MAKKQSALIKLAVGPYRVNLETSRKLAPEIHYRHYKPVELETARRFIEKCMLAGTYYFDVYLASDISSKIAPNLEPNLLPSAVPYMYRIDALCHRMDAIHIIEFKERLRPSAIGELLVYETMFKEQYKPAKKIELDVVAHYDAPSLNSTLERLDIRKWVV